MTPMTTEPIQPWLRPPVIVKVGGSLYDWPELGPRLRRFLDTFPERHVVLVPGGGPFADIVRALDRVHALGDEAAHWLAIHSLVLAGRFIAGLVPGAKMIEGLNAARSAFKRGSVTILDMFRFARGDEARPERLPHVWGATSDSLAARVARVAGAEEFYLLKSIDPPPDWIRTTTYVDPLFAQTIAGAKFESRAVNLRGWTGDS